MKKKKQFLINLFCVMSIGLLLSLPAIVFADCPAGIVAYYKLDDPDGSPTTYTDFISGNNGSAISGGEPVYQANGNVNAARRFEGNMGIDVPASKAFNWSASDSFSIELWMMTDTTPTVNTVLIGRGNSTDNTEVFWWLGLNANSAVPVFYLREEGGTFRRVTGQTPLSDGVWHHLVVTRNGETDEHSIYVDGVIETVDLTTGGGTVVDLGFAISADLNIGYVDGSFNYTGVIDEVALYDGVLPADDILAHSTSGTDYCNGSEPSEPTFGEYPEDTVALWPLDEIDGAEGYQDAFAGHNGDGSADPVYSASGRVNGAQVFNGTNSGINVPASKVFNWSASDSFSIELWMMTDTTPTGNAVLIGRGNSSPSTEVFWWLGLNANNAVPVFYLREEGGTSRRVTGQTPLSDGVWHHIVVTRNGETDEYSLYVDGVAETVSLVPAGGDINLGFATSAGLNIGYVDGDYRYTGMLDEIALYDKAISPEEATDHYTTGTGGESVTSLQYKPTADAGSDQEVAENTVVTLDGSASSTYSYAYATATITGYEWTQTDTSGYTVTLDTTDPSKPTFTAPDVSAPVTLTFSLTVTASDGQTSDPAATVNVVVNDGSGPTANAGADQSVTEGDTVTLDGRASTAGNGGTLTYAWTQIDTTGLTVTLSDTTVARPTFTAPEVDENGVTLTFQLVVTEDGTSSAPSTVDILVGDVLTNPDADAGADQQVNEGTIVALDGSASTAAVGSNLVSYAWTQTDGTGLTVTIADANTQQATFTAPDVGSAGATLTFQLMVTDDSARTATDTVDIVVTDVASSDDGGGGGGCFIDSMSMF